MAIKKSSDLLNGEVLDLSDVIALVSPTDTPIITILMSQGKVVPATDVNVSWREESLDETRVNPALEGADSPDSVVTGRTSVTNLCQILSKTTSVTGTVESLSVKGIGKELNKQILHRLTEIKRDGEYYALQGSKASESGSTGRQMNGFLNLVGNTIDLRSGDGEFTDGNLSEDAITAAFKAMWDRGQSGSSNVVAICNASVKGYINKIFKNSSTLVANAGVDNILGTTVSKLVTDYGEANIVLDRHMPLDQLLILDLDKCEIAELRPAQSEALGKTGDNTKVLVVHEFTVKLYNKYAGSKIVNINGYKSL